MRSGRSARSEQQLGEGRVGAASSASRPAGPGPPGSGVSIHSFHAVDVELEVLVERLEGLDLLERAHAAPLHLGQVLLHLGRHRRRVGMRLPMIRYSTWSAGASFLRCITRSTSIVATMSLCFSKRPRRA